MNVFKKVFLIRNEPSHLSRILLGTSAILFILLVWLILTSSESEERIISPYTLPSIGETIKSFPKLWVDRALMRGIMASLIRVLGGFAMAASIAIPLGIICGCYLRIGAFFRPLSVFGRNIPIAALIPLSLIWFGLGEIQKIMFIFMASVAFIFFDSMQSAKGVSNRFLDTAYTLGAKYKHNHGVRNASIIGILYAIATPLFINIIGLEQSGAIITLDILFQIVLGFCLGFAIWYPIQSHQVIYKVIMPLSMPKIVNSMRLLFGLAFGYIILAEVINAKFGLGHIIIMSQRRGPREHIYLILIIIAILAYIIDRFLIFCQNRWFPYIETKN